VQDKVEGDQVSYSRNGFLLLIKEVRAKQIDEIEIFVAN
jgi:hypothetical protein